MINSSSNLKLNINKNLPQHIGVCIIVVNQKSELLFGKRKNAYKSGYYGLPGGRLEVGEPLETCAKRELLEETSLKTSKALFLGAVRETQRTYDFIHFAFFTKEFGGDVVVSEPEKCEAWEWFALNALPSKILPGHQGAIELYKLFIKNQNPFFQDLYI